jgi:hypothetical protein
MKWVGGFKVQEIELCGTLWLSQGGAIHVLYKYSIF